MVKLIKNSDPSLTLFPPEFKEFNWRLWAFVFIIILAGGALFLYPVGIYKGYVDPFYSPTVLVIPVVALFRISCYAYRKDYYRHVFRHPLACIDGIRFDDNRKGYSGEKTFFGLNNYHRYFLYAGIALLPFFYYDFYVSLTYIPGEFILRLGSLLIIINAIFLTLWTLSCHAFRHLTGGHVDCFSCKAAGNARKKFFNGQSALNRYHEQFAFISLIIVIGVDLYIRGLMAGLPLDFTLLKFAI